jgi:hypothetical protein
MNGPVPTCEYYDFKEGKWYDTISPMPSPRIGASLAYWPRNHSIYVFGGHNGNSLYDDRELTIVDYYTIDTNEWHASDTEPMPKARSYALAVPIVTTSNSSGMNGIILIGGSRQQYRQQLDMLRYEPDEQKWYELSSNNSHWCTPIGIKSSGADTLATLTSCGGIVAIDATPPQSSSSMMGQHGRARHAAMRTNELCYYISTSIDNVIPGFIDMYRLPVSPVPKSSIVAIIA